MVCSAPQPRRRAPGTATAVAIAAALAAVAARGAPESPRESVLLLHSYSPSEWTDDITRGCEAVLARRASVDLRVDYMDAQDLGTAEYLDQLRRLYELKYRGPRFGVVIAADDSALRFALRHQAGVFKGSPVVFCGVNNLDERLFAGQPEVTGVVEADDVEDTLALAFQMRPAARTVLAVCDFTDAGEAALRALKDLLARRYPGRRLEVLRDCTLDEMGERLAGVPERVVVLHLSFWTDRMGRAVAPAALGETFRQSAVPVFTMSEWMVGKGVVGGKCVSGFDQGSEAAQRAVRVLQGERASRIPVRRDSPNKFMFDHRELRRHGIPESELPAGTILANEPGGVLREYRSLAISAAAVFLALLALVVALSVNAMRRERAEAAWQSSERFVRTVVDHAPVVLWALDRHGRFTFSEGLGLRPLGLGPGEVVGQSVYELYAGVPAVVECVRRSLRGETVHEAVLVQGIWYDSFYTPLRTRAGEIDGVIGLALDITSRVQAEKEQRRLARAVEQAAEAILVTDASGTIEYVNPAFERITGYDRAEAVGRRPSILRSGRHDEDFYRGLWSALKKGEAWTGNITNRAKNGDFVEVEVAISPLVEADGRTTGYVAVERDVTEQARLEAQVRQAQKMEAIGQMAGGLAHDFNNLLSPIMGYAGLLLMGRPPEDPEFEPLTQIEGAAERARHLTHQLLAFGRRQAMDVRVFDLGVVTYQLAKMLRSTIRENIQVDVRRDETGGKVRGDMAQVEQVLMNLALNAQDAMPDGGRLAIAVANEDLGESEARAQLGLPGGRYVVLEVSDTGTGIEPRNLERLFEPFFTTKEKKGGIGLGLATSYGIVRQHGGAIQVSSEPGRGATFRVYLPRVDEPVAPAPAGAARTGLPGGTETIVVAEDDENVRRLACTILGAHGYRTHGVARALDGLEKLAELEEPVHLLLTDVVMPDMDGRELSRRVARFRPGLKVLFMSGHAREVVEHHGVTGASGAFLEKPFTVESLTRKVREVLDS